MRTRRTKTSRPRLNKDADRMVTAAKGLAASGSRVEDLYWEKILVPAAVHLLEAQSEDMIEAVLDEVDPRSQDFEALIDTFQSAAESIEIEHEGVSYQALLVAAPLVAWTRYEIPSGPLRAEARETLRAHLQAHVAAPGVRVALAPALYSPDQFPDGLTRLYRFTRALAEQALGLQKVAPAGKLPESAPMLADTRHLLAAFVAPAGDPLFRWQELSGKKPPSREQVLLDWQQQGQPNIAALLTGCEIELMLPDAFHGSRREADRKVRGRSLVAGIEFLEAGMQAPPAQVRAIVAPFGDVEIDEYRIGLTLRNNSDVVHGVVWPLYDAELGPEPGGPLEQIESALRELKVTSILVLDERFAPEYCDDCGAPLFADASGELVHPELPEEADVPNTHLH